VRRASVFPAQILLYKQAKGVTWVCWLEYRRSDSPLRQQPHPVGRPARAVIINLENGIELKPSCLSRLASPLSFPGLRTKSAPFVEVRLLASEPAHPGVTCWHIPVNADGFAT